MKNIGWILLLAASGVLLASCTTNYTPASNSTANTTNSNAAAKPASNAPSAATLMGLDKTATEAYWKGDGKAFETILSDKFTFAGNKNGPDKAGAIKEISGVKCEIKSSNFEDPQSYKISDDAYVVNYKGTVDGTCNDGPNGATQKLPSPFRGTTVWIRNGENWQAAFHGENPVVDPKAPPKAEAKPASESAPGKTDQPASTAAAKSPNTDAVLAVEKAAWTAWMNKDAKGLEATVGKDLAFATQEGTWMHDRAGILKYWADLPCTDLKNLEFKDPFSTSLGTDVEMLTFTASLEGTCGGQKAKPVAAMGIYAKQDGAWKLIFGYEAAS